MADSSPARGPPPQRLLQPGSQIPSSYYLNQNYMVVFCYEILDIFSRLCPSDTKMKCQLPSFFFYNKYLGNIWLPGSMGHGWRAFICISCLVMYTVTVWLGCHQEQSFHQHTEQQWQPWQAWLRGEKVLSSSSEGRVCDRTLTSVL